jgi:hypothetical protein
MDFLFEFFAEHVIASHGSLLKVPDIRFKSIFFRKCLR